MTTPFYVGCIDVKRLRNRETAYGFMSAITRSPFQKVSGMQSLQPHIKFYLSIILESIFPKHHK
jgi:hypothetical protein